jgi:hypothetical protein
MSLSSLLAVSMMIGTSRVRPSALSRRQTSSPSTAGSMRSRTIRSGGSRRAALSASSPLATHST